MEHVSALVLTTAALATLATIWLRDRLKGEAARHPHGFQRQDSRQTLREGLAEFYAERGLLAPRPIQVMTG